MAVLLTSCGGGDDGAAAPPTIDGVVVERAPGRQHQNGEVTYQGKHPPSGGNHNPYPLTCGAYDQQPPDEYAVHSLEHGAVWIAYDPSTSPSDVDTLRTFAKQDHVLVTPYTGMDAPITLVAWEHRLELNSVTDPRLKQFVDGYRSASTAPEPKNACRGAGQPLPLP